MKHIVFLLFLIIYNNIFIIKYYRQICRNLFLCASQFSCISCITTEYILNMENIFDFSPFPLIFSSPVVSTGSELMSSPVYRRSRRRRRRPMLTFAFRSNVDNYLAQVDETSHVSLSWIVEKTAHKYRSPWPTISAWMTSTFLRLGPM